MGKVRGEFMAVPHLMDVIPWTLLGGVHAGASSIGCNSTRVTWWCLKVRT
ncbi:hypothetical protein DEO72_LG8g1105 [Vigna unguiculata]|uniref:Uncharacterized protein n=1 Tax=Vigna unguiculata TaxID=3917 RepID=A0A4D6MNM9_VIGUN|nr:hypothetical protein DEO72_LG8g1105 [Vigna unguiculata]